MARRYNLTRSGLEVLASYPSCVYVANQLFIQDEMYVTEEQVF